MLAGSKRKHKTPEDTSSSSSKRARSSSSQVVPRLLQHHELIQLYSAHQQRNNEPVKMICETILQAKRSVLLKIFNIGSPRILAALAEASNRAPVSVHYQMGPFSKHCTEGNVQFRPRRGCSLLHRKTLLIDNNIVVTGTANYTEVSLEKDVNLTAKIFSEHLYRWAFRHDRGEVRVGSQQVSYYSLSQIRRDLCVKAILEANGIVLRERTCEGILHTKVCCIDSSTLIIGSVNWSRGGLTLNLEEFLIINPLTETQLECYNELWAHIETNSRLMTKELIQLHEKRKKSITDPKQISSSTQDEENASTSAEQQF